MFNCLCNSVDLKEEESDSITLEKLVEYCNTGDILLFSSNTIFGDFIKKATDSIYTHVGIILKNPTFVKDKDDSEIKLYLYNSDGPYTKDVEKQDFRAGVQVLNLIEKVKNFNGKIYYRKLNYDKEKISFINDKLKYIHFRHYNTYYDYMPNNWLGVYLSMLKYNKLSKMFTSPRHLDQMFCSAFTAYIYTELGIFKPDTEWSFFVPSHFEKINNLENNYSLEKIKILL